MQNRLRRYIISGFATVAAFSGLITTAHLLFTSTAFYLAVTVCFLLAICCVVAWQKTERTKYVKQSLHAIFVRLSENVDSEAVIGINEIVVYYGMKDEVANTLGEMICTKPDPTERYWHYIALGMMGGKKAESIIENSLADDNEFARNGAVEAQKLLRNPKRRTRKRDKLLFSYFGEYISSVVSRATAPEYKNYRDLPRTHQRKAKSCRCQRTAPVALSQWPNSGRRVAAIKDYSAFSPQEVAET